MKLIYGNETFTLNISTDNLEHLIIIHNMIRVYIIVFRGFDYRRMG